MIVVIKNITAETLEIEAFLFKIGIQECKVNKDTYILEKATEEQYEKLVKFSTELGEKDKVIFVKKNGL